MTNSQKMPDMIQAIDELIHREGCCALQRTRPGGT